MEKIYRKDKIDLLSKIYLSLAEEFNVKILNQIIIDSVGVSGLGKVKEIAWKN